MTANAVKQLCDQVQARIVADRLNNEIKTLLRAEQHRPFLTFKALVAPCNAAKSCMISIMSTRKALGDGHKPFC